MWAWPSSQQADGGAELAGRAIAALEGVVLDEGVLDRMQRAVGTGQAFDRGDRRAILHHRQGQAGVDPDAVDQDGAGAALAVVAAFLGAGQIEVQAQQVQQRRPGRDREVLGGCR